MKGFRNGRVVIAALVALAAAGAAAGNAVAQGAAPTPSGAPAPAIATAVGFDKLEGTWVRPDGGYRIVIGNVGADGRIEAHVLQPEPAPFCEGRGVDGR